MGSDLLMTWGRKVAHDGLQDQRKYSSAALYKGKEEQSLHIQPRAFKESEGDICKVLFRKGIKIRERGGLM